MGAKTWMLVYSNGDVPSFWGTNPSTKQDKNLSILQTLFPHKRFSKIETGSLQITCPSKGEVQIADLGGLVVVATDVVAIDNPSKIPHHLLRLGDYKYTYVFAMHSVVDWFAFAIWENGQLIRALSLSPETGVIEDIGTHLAFEVEYWDGKHAAIDPDDVDNEETYPLAFHPLDFGENTLLHLMGFQYEGVESLNKVKPDDIAMHCFRQKKWWKIW